MVRLEETWDGRDGVAYGSIPAAHIRGVLFIRAESFRLGCLSSTVCVDVPWVDVARRTASGDSWAVRSLELPTYPPGSPPPYFGLKVFDRNALGVDLGC